MTGDHRLKCRPEPRWHAAHCCFENADEADAWESDVFDVLQRQRDHVGFLAIFDHRWGKGPKENCSTWLQLVNHFIRRWGRSRTPADIRHYLNTVETDQNMPLTVWPDVVG